MTLSEMDPFFTVTRGKVLRKYFDGLLPRRVKRWQDGRTSDEHLVETTRFPLLPSPLSMLLLVVIPAV